MIIENRSLDLGNMKFNVDLNKNSFDKVIRIKA